MFSTVFLCNGFKQFSEKDQRGIMIGHINSVTSELN